MIDRGAFLRLAAAAAGLVAVREVKASPVPTLTKYDNNALFFMDVVQHWSGGIRPIDFSVKRINNTGDARKYLISALHPTDGKWYTKVALLSGCLLVVAKPSSHKAELGYQIAMRTKELARDWAYLEWGDDWRFHVPHKGWWTRV